MTTRNMSIAEAKSRILAVTREPSPNMDQCELTYVARAPIDYGRALRQHQEYCEMLGGIGAEVRTLEANRTFPDCVFVEDTAIVLDEVAVIASMGAESRRGETAAIERELRNYGEIQRINLPATIEGGDVVRIGQKLLVGLSTRTNRAGAESLQAIVRPFGYSVITVPLKDCLHLKSACCALPDGRLLVNPDWLDLDSLRGFEFLRVPEEEPWAADILSIGKSVCVLSAHLRTAEMIHKLSFDVRTIDLSEFAKAEGGVTCLSLLLRLADPPE